MEIAVLHKYLSSNNPNYTDGVELYAKFGNNQSLNYLFSLGNTIYNHKKLLAELRKIAEAHKPIVEVKKVSFTPIIEPKKEAINVNELPQELRQLNVKKGDLFSLMSYLHSQLTVVDTNDKRSDLVTEIKKIDAEIKDIWKQLDYFQANKTMLVLPAQKSTAELSKEDAFKRLLNVRTNISKLKKNPKRSTDLAKLEAEKTELEKIVGK